MLLHLTIKSHRQRLYSTTNAEYWHLPVISQTGDEEFWKVTCAVDVTEVCRRFFSRPQRVDIGTARKHQSVEMLERSYNYILIIDRGYKHRSAARF